MKKMIAVLLALTLVFTLAACSSSPPDPGSFMHPGSPGPRAGPGHRTAGDGTQSVSVLLRSKKAPSGAPTGFQLPHPCFLPDALYTAQPPARSNDERGAYFWIGVSNMHYLLLS